MSVIAHTNFASGSNPVTSAAINTSGADLIVVAYNNAHIRCDLSDSKGNSWTLISADHSVAGSLRSWYYVINPIVGSGHTFTLSNGDFVSAVVAAFSGYTGGIDGAIATADAGNGSTTVQPGSKTPSANNSLLWTVIFSGADTSNSDVSSIDSSFTILDNVTNHSGAYFMIADADLEQGTAGAVNPTWTFASTGSGNSASMVVFAPTGGTTNYTLNANTGSYAIGGVDATLTSTRTLAAATGSYAISGVDATLTHSSVMNYTLNADTGSYVFTGFSALLQWSGAPSSFPQVINVNTMGLS